VEAPITFNAYMIAVCGPNSWICVESLKNEFLEILFLPEYKGISQVYALWKYLGDEAKMIGARA
jgi:hypothetical protein